MTQIKDDDGNWVVVAGGQRTWVGTKAALQTALNNDEIPNGTPIMVTDDYAEGTEIVDAVENGNMKAVTSNAVYDALQTTYSTEETKTGATWIDGKPIYRKVFVAPNTLGEASGLINIPWPNIDSPVTFSGYAEVKSTVSYAPCKRILPFGYYNDDATTGSDLWAIHASVMGNGSTSPAGLLLQVGSEASKTIDKFVLVLEYTKTTDA